jgi:hypothetical protein
MTMPTVPAADRLDPGLLAVARDEPSSVRWTDERFLGAIARTPITDVSVLARRSIELLGVLLAENH